MLLDVDTTADRFSLLMAGIVDMKKTRVIADHYRDLKISPRNFQTSDVKIQYEHG